MAEEKKAEPAKEPAAAKAAPAKKGGMLGMIVCMVLFGAAMPFLYPTLFLFIGMMPTVVTLLTSNDRQGTSAMTVGALNLAGILPFVIELWEKGQTLGNALAILREPETWLVMFGAAAVGQLILFAVPQAIATATSARADTRLKLLKENLDRLKIVWGPDVATVKPFDKIAKGQ